MKLLDDLKRIGLDIGVLLVIALLMIFVPSSFLPIEAKANLVSLFFTKFILVSAGVVHAHITRKFLFPYIDFSKEEDLTNNIMIIAIYVVVIFAWSRGG